MRRGAWTADEQASPYVIENVLVPNDPNTPGHSYLQTEFTFKSLDRKSTPRLKAFQVSARCGVIPG